MKSKQFEIIDTTLFVYKQQKKLRGTPAPAGTDPTTSMIRMTVTGLLDSGRSK